MKRKPVSLVSKNLLVQELTADEGFRLVPYDDKNGKPIVPGYTLIGNATIGAGINLTEGLRPHELDYLLHSRIAEAEVCLDANVSWWRRLNAPRQRALTNMCFNLGWPRFSKFKRMLAALEVCDWEAAANEVLLNGAGDGPSKYSLDVGDRADRIAVAFRYG